MTTDYFIRRLIETRILDTNPRLIRHLFSRHEFTLFDDFFTFEETDLETATTTDPVRTNKIR